MAINAENTKKLKKRLFEETGVKPTIQNKTIYGCDCIYVEVNDSINLDALKRISDKIGNTMTISSVENGVLKILIW
jgi:hypothetical protein